MNGMKHLSISALSDVAEISAATPSEWISPKAEEETKDQPRPPQVKEEQPSDREDAEAFITETTEAVQGTSADASIHCHICNSLLTKECLLEMHLRIHDRNSDSSQSSFWCLSHLWQMQRQSLPAPEAHVTTLQVPLLLETLQNEEPHNGAPAHTHTGEKPFSCHVCQMSFNRGSTLRKHMVNLRREERPYKCDHCHDLFPELMMLKRHMRDSRRV